MKKINLYALLLALFAVIGALPMRAGTDIIVREEPKAGFFDLCGAAIIYDNADNVLVSKVAQMLAADIKAVTGMEVAINPDKNPLNLVIIGTVGQSPIVDKLVKAKKIDVSAIRGGWEQYVIKEINHPMKGVDSALVIAGCDRRGTAYGTLALSEAIGVSPWYWWADAPIIPKKGLYVKADVVSDAPAVKYRGIFINDEWPSFGTWATNQFGGINSQMYSKMFELLLRLKANYLWPAMWNSAFNEDDPATQALANDYGIVMGTSHHEPMMRAHKEYTRRRDQIGAWDLRNNRENIVQFFTAGVKRAKDYDNIITIGMRGDGDVALGKNDEECMETLADVIATQRGIIEDVYQRPAAEVPQLWAIFTEVQRYYDAGFNVPDDVTLLFCDNNWGYIRRTGPEKERNRAGGMGLYYHIDMNGGPWNDRWVNTTTVAKMREQLNLAYRTGLDRIWIINVGDLKPKEMPIDFIMHYAWNPDAYPADKVDDYMVGWARGIFGDEYAREIADIVNEYSKLNLERKPEVQIVGIYSPEIGEAQRMMKKWDDLEQRTLSLSSKIPEKYKDAFYQLVEYPAVASAGVAKMYLAATMGDSLMVQELFERDSLMTHRYNNEMSSGKWRGMMLDRHIGYNKWSMPEENVAPKAVEQKYDPANMVEPDEISIMAYDFSRRTATDDAQWIFLPGLGREQGCMGIWPVTAPSRPDASGPCLEYDVEINRKDDNILALGILPTNDINPARGLRIAVAVDDNDPIIVDARQGYVDSFAEYNEKNIARSGVLKPLPAPACNIYLAGTGKHMRNEIFDNIRWLSINLGVLLPGAHTIRVIMVDPEIVVEKLIINPDNDHPSYYGKPA